MKYTLSWVDQLKSREGLTYPIYDLIISPDGNFLLLGSDNKIYVYDVVRGTLLHTLKGHRELVLCLSYSHDGNRFVSGSSDKQVIIWTHKMEAILKYTHSDSVRCLRYNPKSMQILSCTTSEIGLWSPEQKMVSKTKTSSQINCCCWNEDGTMFAVGMNSGMISIRQNNGEEKFKIDRSSGAVWAIMFFRSQDSFECIAAADWSRNLSFYNGSNGSQIGNSRSLNFDPLFVSFISIAHNDFLIIGGSNRKVQVYTVDGIYLDTITTQNSWIWSYKIQNNRCAIGCEDGTVAVYDLSSTTVHSLYKQRYAWRDSMTDVVILHLKTNERVRIKCRDLVKKIAVYEKSIAIQLTERVVIYELAREESRESELNLNYKVKEKLALKIDCSLLVLCSSNLIFCQQRRLESVRLQDGKSEHEWTFPSTICYVKVIGGAPKQEALAVALNNGQIITIFLNNIFHFDRFRHPNGGIRFVDLSAKHRRFALTDDRRKLSIYDLETSNCIYQKSNIISCSWNSEIEEVLCMCTGDKLLIAYIQNGERNQIFEEIINPQMPDKSYVIGFSGANIYVLQENTTVVTLRISYSRLFHQLIKSKASIQECFRVASMNVAKEDWDVLAKIAMKNYDLDVVRKSFYCLENYRFIPLLDKYQNDSNPNSSDLFEAECFAYEGLFSEAAKIYRNKLQQDGLAYNMFVDLKMYEQAKDYSTSNGDAKHLDDSIINSDFGSNINHQLAMNDSNLNLNLNTLENIRQCISGKNYNDAQKILNQVGVGSILTFLPEVDKGESTLLKFFGETLTKNGHFNEAAEVYKKGHDVVGLAQLYSQTGQWSEAIKIMFDYGPSQRMNLLKPVNEFRLSSEQFTQAQAVFYQAGQSEQLEKILLTFVSNSVRENRFDDCSYYSWLLSLFYEQANEKLSLFKTFSKNSEIYYCYHIIHKYIEEPYTAVFIEILFYCALFLYRFIDGSLPEGVSKVNILFALAKLGKHLKHYKLVRIVYKKLQQFILPARFEELIEVGSIDIKTKPFIDDEDLGKFCYRCSASNTFQNSTSEQDDRCFNCLQPFVHSFYSFDILPLVEFEIDPNIGENQESIFNRRNSGLEAEKDGEREEKWSATIESDQSQRIQLYEHSEMNDDSTGDDHQIRILNSAEINPISNLSVLNAGQLSKLDAASVLIIRQRDRKRYFLNALPEIAITNCETCNKFFYSDEYEFQRLQNGKCPFCRN